VTSSNRLQSFLCPEPVSLYAPCICTKNENSLMVSRAINSNVKWSCDSNDDVTSVQQMFAAYCNMLDGTTSFPTLSPPPGDMTYYITALDGYSSLVPCAQSAVSAAFREQTSSYCPDGPQALASCVCLRDSKSRFVSSVLTSEVKWSCSSTASEDISSAVAVLDYYCSAANGDVVATVEESSMCPLIPLPEILLTLFPSWTIFLPYCPERPDGDRFWQRGTYWRRFKQWRKFRR
jgi:hypothetical protein